MIEKKYIKLIALFIVTVGIFIFIFSRVSFTEVLQELRKARPGYIIAALFISALKFGLITPAKWRRILIALGCAIPLKESILIKLGSYSVISILPLRIGELSRLIYLKRLRNVSYIKSTFSVIMEYALNFIILIFFISLGFIFYAFQEIMLAAHYTHLYYSSSLGIGLFTVQKAQEEKRSPLLKLQQLYAAHKPEYKKIMFDWKIWLYAFTYNALTLFNFFLLAKALDIHFPLYALLSFTPFVIISGRLPITIAGTGTRELAVMFLFSSYAASDVLVSLGLLFLFIDTLFPILIGTFLTGFFIDRMIIRKAQEEDVPDAKKGGLSA